MAHSRSIYVCQECGATKPKWAGRCESCGAWNALVEEAAGSGAPSGLGRPPGPKRRLELETLNVAMADRPRQVTGLGEFDRVCGGGLVPGSALLVGGDPGIGKSTLLLQIAASWAGDGPALYISGEEATEQIRMRAARLRVSDAPVRLAAATSVADVIAILGVAPTPGLVVIDSIQTMYAETLESAPGTVGQVRAAAQELVRAAKRRGFALILVGHVTKEGAIAGPRVLEHMVDAVLYFEGDRGHQFRILRGVKNRFGPTDEIGVFTMTERGLEEVPNPSALFLTERDTPVSGAAVFAGMEGTRPVLVEIQALVAPSPLGTPRRTAVGWDGGRLAMVLAVLEARCGLGFAGRDIFLNVAGGLRVSEPAADLAVAAAIVSAYADRPVWPDAVVFGEIGLSGEIRAVGHTDARLKEAAKLGFNRAVTPQVRQASAPDILERLELGHVVDLVERLSAEGSVGS